ncbi:MAG: M23 family metallopeptidase [Opitutaceae bacterium]|nr:M23 family metallopeptidase [Opitutaceae bacterium]
MRRLLAVAVWTLAPLSAFAASVPKSERFPLVWPTSGTAWAEGKPPSQWLQHAGSGDPDSGSFGGVRSGGAGFHEGLDIKPTARDRRGEPLDEIRAAMPGVVRHVSAAAGGSSYGRYVVLEHPAMTPAVYTLYAHLAQIAPGLRAGDAVTAGQTLGRMGHSSGGYMIPVDRSHLHFEIGLVATQNFQAWYDRKKMGSRNEHGMWNGMNLLGLDPLAFYEEWRAGRLATAHDFFARMEPAVRVRVATYRTPDFVTRYPSLVTKPVVGLVSGWEVLFNWTGLPFAWTPLTATEVAGLAADQPRIVEVNAPLLKRQRSKSLALTRRGGWVPGKDLERVLEQVFGGR